LELLPHRAASTDPLPDTAAEASKEHSREVLEEYGVVLK
jgi:hypothetical protein